MCCENENENNNVESCKCLRDLLKDIIKLQKQDFTCCKETGCDKPFLGPTPNLVCYNTRPLNFYNCCTGNLWEIEFTCNGTTSTSSVFRVENLDDCCCKCRILIDKGNNCYQATNEFFVIDLNCVSAIKCRPDVFVEIC